MEFQLTYKPWIGTWVSARWRVGERLGDPDSGEEYERPDVKKRTSTVSGVDSPRHRAAVETTLLSTIMPLVEHMCITRYDDGDPREPGWVTIKTMGAAWVVQIKDPDSGTSFQSIGDTLDKALETAALLLSCDEAPWANDPFLKRKAAPKK